MGIINKKLVGATALTTTGATLYTCPASTNAIISSIRIANIVSNSATFTLYFVDSGGSAGDSTNSVGGKQVTIAAGQIYTDMSSIILNAGDFISAKSSADNSLLIYISGIEIN